MENRRGSLFNGRMVDVYKKYPKRLPLEVIHFLDTISSLTYVKYKTTIHTYWKMAGVRSGIKPLKSNVPEFTLQRRPEIMGNPYFNSVFHLKEAMIRKCLNETLTKDQKESIEESIRGNYGSC